MNSTIFKAILLSLLLQLTFTSNIFANDTTSLRKHFLEIIQSNKARNHKNIDELNRVASYINSQFQPFADSVYFQSYIVNGKAYKNVIAVFGSHNPSTIVVGAHYDVCGEQDGADDNASGVVGLLKLAEMLHKKKLNHRIELVAYTLEEPPFFRTENMGSYVHAKSLYDQKRDVYGMFCLEMIGYFKDERKSQRYPIGALSLIYGNRGNYITLVNKLNRGKFSRKFNRAFTQQKNIRTKKFTAPEKLPGIDFSDHLNYWTFGYSAFMITDTAFYRNFNYHQKSDKLHTLDLNRMNNVIETVFHSLLKM